MHRPEVPGRSAVAGLILIALLAGACSAGAPSAALPSDVAALATVTPTAEPASPDGSGLAFVSPAASTAPAASPTASPSASLAPKVTPKPTAKPTPRPTPKPTKPPPPAPSLVIRTEATGLGAVLAGADHLTLYIHAGDGTNHSSCTGTCIANWPAVLVAPSTKVTGGPGVHGHFATFKRSDGTTQVSYNGHPLYTWPGDLYAGDTTGQGLGGFSVAKP